MKDLKKFDIPFVGLKIGKHKFEYQVTDAFFEYFQYDDFFDATFVVVLNFVKKPTHFELSFESKGSATVYCDLSYEPFQLELEGALDLIVRFGEMYNDDSEELLIIPHGSYELNVAQYIYEMIALSVPYRRIHPGVEDGTLKSDVLKKLEEFKEVKEKQMDPRWEKLKELQTNKKYNNGTS